LLDAHVDGLSLAFYPLISAYFTIARLNINNC
jgi:hypothetical protein